MARPERNNVDYFPFLCDDGKKMFYIEETYGNDGFATFLKLLRELAKTDYHYLDLSKNTTLMFLSAKCKISKELMLSIIADLVELGKFNEMLWNENKIIWCQDFINSIQDAYKKRNNDCITFEGLLLLLESLGIRKPSIVTSTVPVKPQSIVKDIKEEETKEKETKKNENSDFINELVIDFEFNEMRFANQQKKVMEFVNVLSFHNRLDHFKSQYQDYKEFKKLSGQTSHAFPSFIGTVKEQFEDGAWNSDNWSKKLETEKIKQKTNGTKNQSGAGRRSNLNPTPTSGYSKL